MPLYRCLVLEEVFKIIILNIFLTYMNKVSQNLDIRLLKLQNCLWVMLHLAEVLAEVSLKGYLFLVTLCFSENSLWIVMCGCLLYLDVLQQINVTGGKRWYFMFNN